MLRPNNLIVKWPLKDFLKVSIGVYSIYLTNKYARKYISKFYVFLQYKLACWEDNDKSYTEIKELLFNDLSFYLKKIDRNITQSNPLNVIEIGIGCGNNFRFYPENSLIIGLDPNGLCEPYTYKRLYEMNTIYKKNIILKDFLVGYAENMSYIRNDSIECIVCTNVLDHVEDINETLNEIYRILKPNGIFVFMEPIELEHNKMKKYIQNALNKLNNYLQNKGLQITFLNRFKFGLNNELLIEKMTSKKTNFINSKVFLSSSYLTGISIK